jgi:tRNA pseudouridine55 synthase
MRRKAFLTSPAAPDDSADYPSITLRIVCSKGTYIRALARDIGQALGSGAHLTALRRTRIGDIRVDDCLSMQDFPQWLEGQEVEVEKLRD